MCIVQVWLRSGSVQDLQGKPGAGPPQQCAGRLQQAGAGPAARRLAHFQRNDPGGSDCLPAGRVLRVIPYGGADVWAGSLACRHVGNRRADGAGEFSGFTQGCGSGSTWIVIHFSSWIRIRHSICAIYIWAILFFALFLNLRKVFIGKYFLRSWIRIRIKKVAGSESALRKTAGSAKMNANLQPWF